MGQQPVLAPQPTAETNQATIDSNYPVAGNNDQQGILVVSLTNGSGGFRPAASCRYLAISSGLAIRNLFKLSPDLLLKSSPGRLEFQLKLLSGPSEIFIQLPPGGRYRLWPGRRFKLKLFSRYAWPALSDQRTGLQPAWPSP